MNLSTIEKPSAISPAEFLKVWDKEPKPRLLDVRMPAEFREMHVDGAINLPLDQLTRGRFVDVCGTESGQPVYIVCRSGSRGRQACEKLRAEGVDHVINIEGGTLACAEAGLSVIRGKKSVSLERQVRIAAGSFVLIGAILGYFVAPALIGISAFIGAGLMFSGITDTCGMGMMLAKMPWNQSGSAAACATK